MEKNNNEINEYIKKLTNIQSLRQEYFNKKEKDKMNFYSLSNIKEINNSLQNHFQDNQFKLFLDLFINDDEKNKFICSYMNPGTNAKMQRYRLALERAIYGYVRNPYMISSLLYPENEELITKQLNEEIIKK